MHNETFEVTDEYEEERLDKFLAAIYPEQSRSFFQKLIKDGLVWSQKPYLLYASDNLLLIAAHH